MALDNSLGSTDYTIAYSALSCALPAFVFHICFAYLSVISGILAILTRIIPSLKSWHGFFGRMFLLVILWCTASSVLIHNTGLPRPIMIFLCIMLVSITVGWLAIRIHMDRLEKRAMEAVERRLKETSSKDFALNTIISQEKSNILNQRSFWERLFSMKSLHGLLMVYGWYQMFGRTIVTNPFSWEGCWTYPAYKSEDGVAVFVPAEDPDGFSNELAFSLGVQLPALALFIVIGIVYCVVVHFRSRREDTKSISSSK